MKEKEYQNIIHQLQEQVIEKDKDIKELNLLLKAYSKVEKMTNQELIDAEKRVRAQEQISHFSVKELELRDVALRNVLEVNKQISTIHDVNTLLQIVLDSLITSLKAERGILFVVEKEFLIAKLFNNFEHAEMQSEYFEYCRFHIDYVFKTKKSVFKLFQELETKTDPVTLSFVCLPLIYDNRLLGIIYLDIISETKTFRVQDLDIAEIFSSQAAISMNNAKLYHKIQGQNLELLKLINIKDQLIDEVSKKIRRPMMQVHGLIDKLIKDNADFADDPVFFHISTIFSLVAKVMVTIEKVVKIQDLEKEVNDLFSETINFKELFDFIIEFYKEEIEKKNIKINIDLSKSFSRYHANMTIMRTIFDELISNAILYNKPNGTVDIKGKRKGDYLFITITDTGNGIKKEDIEKIFQQFYRTEASPEMNDKGAGLGLYLVKKFIKYYNGDITVESVFGEGSTFTATFMVN